MIRIATCVLMLGTLLLLPAAAAGEEPAAPDSARSAGDDSLSGYLGELADETDDSFGIDILSISDAEIDSLIRIYEETGRSPYDTSAQSRTSRWDLDLGIGDFRYNRVEGVNLLIDGSLAAPTPQPLSAFGEIGYAWALEEVTWLAGLRARLARRWGRPTVEANYGRLVRRYGAGDVRGGTAVAFLFGEDYGDYYRSERWSFWLQFSPGPLRIDFNYRIEEQSSVEKQTDWSIFQWDSGFRPNPPIDDGDVGVLRLELGAGDAELGSLAADVEAAIAGGGLGGDFDYESLRGIVTGRRSIWLGDQITVKASGGFAGGDTPYQALHHLGGFHALRGYDINEIPARQFAHLGFDYKFGTDLLGYLPFVNRLRVQLVPFFDAAAIFERQTLEGAIVDPEETEFLSSIGLGVQKNFLGIPGGTGQLRLDIASRLDRGSDTMTYRLLITFER